jgi:hypothetical protein
MRIEYSPKESTPAYKYAGAQTTLRSVSNVPSSLAHWFHDELTPCTSQIFIVFLVLFTVLKLCKYFNHEALELINFAVFFGMSCFHFIMLLNP